MKSVHVGKKVFGLLLGPILFSGTLLFFNPPALGEQGVCMQVRHAQAVMKLLYVCGDLPWWSIKHLVLLVLYYTGHEQKEQRDENNNQDKKLANHKLMVANTSDAKMRLR